MKKLLSFILVGIISIGCIFSVSARNISYLNISSDLQTKFITNIDTLLNEKYKKVYDWNLVLLGKVDDYELFYNVTDDCKSSNYQIVFGKYLFEVFKEQKPYYIGLYIKKDNDVHTLSEAELQSLVNMDEVVDLINKNNQYDYNFKISEHNIETQTGTTVLCSDSVTETTQPATESTSVLSTTKQKSTIPGGAYVTYNLTNVTSSNMQEEVWGYYETTFSPEPGYKINYISIKQGVEDMDVINNGDGTYTFKNNGGFINNLTITATAIPSSPKLTLNMIYSNAGSSRVVKVIDGTVKSWSTSNKNVATVNNGKVTAVGKGTATITATLTTGQKLTCKVTVTTSPSMTSTNISLKSGTSKTIKVVGGTVKSWTTSNKKVATVNNGKVTALNKGSATITATLTTGKKITCKVVVTTAPKLSKATVKVKKGSTATVKLSGKVATINNKYTNTKGAKITSKANATTLKIKGLKKGTTILKIKVNGVKTLNLKVNVK